MTTRHLLPLLTILLGVFLAASPERLQAQEVDGAIANLRGEAMGLLRGCDYLECLEMVDMAMEGWDFIKDLKNDIKGRDRRGMPLTDYISMVLRGGGTYAAKEAAEAESRNLLYQLEQVCNTAVQLDEIARMLEVTETRSRGIEMAIDWVLDDSIFDSEYERAGSERARIIEEYTSLYAIATPGPGTPQDTLWASIDHVLHETLSAGEEYEQAVDRIHGQIGELKRQLVHLAEPVAGDEDEDGEEGEARWECPEGYPSADELEEFDQETGYPVCGPLTPERAKQVLAHVEVLKLEIAAIRLDTDARGLEVDAVRLMTDTHNRKLGETARVRSLRVAF